MFYGKANAEARGESYPYPRYTGHPEAENDPFALDLSADPNLRGLYLDAEEDSGYVRDRNVFGEPITIEDTHSVTARYRDGTLLSYSLVAYSPWEGLRVAITGTRGRVELYDRHGSHIISGQTDEELAAAQSAQEDQHVTVFPMFKPPYRVDVARSAGGHGGGDAAVLDRILLPDPPPDPLKRDAGPVQGAASILLGVAAEKSIASGRPVRIADLLELPEGRPSELPAGM
jgi:hypothetical protein